MFYAVIFAWGYSANNLAYLFEEYSTALGGVPSPQKAPAVKLQEGEEGGGVGRQAGAGAGGGGGEALLASGGMDEPIAEGELVGGGGGGAVGEGEEGGEGEGRSPIVMDDGWVDNGAAAAAAEEAAGNASPLPPPPPPPPVG